MIDRFSAESIQFAKDMSDEAKQTGLELGRALSQAVDDIPALEAVALGLEGQAAEVLRGHLLTLHVFRRFLRRAEATVASMPAA